MAITNITISQDNKVGDSNLCPVHSPLVFIVDVTYDSQEPTELLVDIISNSEVLETYKCIPYNDPLASIRQFAFVANDVIKGLMGNYDDFSQLNNTLEYVDNITKLVTFKFKDPDNELTFDEVVIDLIHGSAQFGDNPNLADIYNNEDQVYYGADGQIVYIYFYNEDPANVLVIDNPSVIEDFAADFDDEIFTDFNDEEFTILANV